MSPGGLERVKIDGIAFLADQGEAVFVNVDV